MKKQNSIKLSIPKPCSQNWDGMTESNAGRHCENCQKTVVDFSNFTDKELIEFFKKATGKICGRLNPYQVNRPMLIPEQNKHSFFYKTALGTALVAGLTITVNGQTTQQNLLHPIEVPTTPHIKMGEVKLVHKERHTISGRIKDSKTKLPITNAVIFITGTGDAAYSDSTGAYELDVPDSLIGKKITLMFSSQNHASYGKEISASGFPKKMNIAMKPEITKPFMGDISY